MERTGGKRKWRGIASFVIVLAFIFSVAWQSSASADQTVAEKLLDIMRANHEITDQQYKDLKKQAEEEKAAMAAGIAQQVKTETAKVAEAAKPVVTPPPAGVPEGGMNFQMKGINVNLGGFIEAGGIYRSRNENQDIGSSFNKLPLQNSAAFFQDETRFSARQSRLSVLAQGDYSPTVHLAGYYEMDFLGGAPTANSNESNSYNLRIRHLYTTTDLDSCGLHFLAGQSWSLVTQNANGITPRDEDIPLTIDAQYVPGFNWARQAQFRVTKDWNKEFWLAVSVENPQTTAAVAVPGQTLVTNYAINQTGGSLFGNTLSVNDVPDIVVKAAWESCWGHFEVFDLVRTFQSDLVVTNGPATGTVTRTDKMTDSVGGGFDIPIIPKQLNIEATAMYGSGIGRYGSGQLPDVTQDYLGDIHPITALHLLTGLTWLPTKDLQFYGYIGMEKADPLNLDHNTTAYGYGSNLYDDTVGPVVTSTHFQGQIEEIDQITIGDWYSFYHGKFGVMKAGLQYSYTQNKYFSGNTTGTVEGTAVGGPTANDHMVFTSIRYYWK